VRKWQFSWNSTKTKEPFADSQYPFIRSSFHLTLDKTLDSYVIQLNQQVLQRFSDEEFEWKNFLGVKNLDCSFSVDEDGYFQEEFTPASLTDGRKSWGLWVDNWIGVDVVQSMTTNYTDTEQSEILVDNKLEHWGKPCLALTDNTKLTTGGEGTKYSVSEVTLEWGTLRPHLATYTQCEIKPSFMSMEKVFYVFDWKDVIFSAGNKYYKPTEDYDLQFDSEIRENFDELLLGAKNLQFASGNNSTHKTPVASPSPLLPPSYSEVTQDSFKIQQDPKQHSSVSDDDNFPFLQSPPPSGSFPSYGGVPTSSGEKEKEKEKENKGVEPTTQQQQTGTEGYTKVLKEKERLEEEGVQIVEIPNTILLAEIQHLRNEVRSLKDQYSRDISSLNLLISHLKDSVDRLANSNDSSAVM